MYSLPQYTQGLLPVWVSTPVLVPPQTHPALTAFLLSLHQLTFHTYLYLVACVATVTEKPRIPEVFLQVGYTW